MYYRFKNGTYVQAETFEEAKDKLITQIVLETEESGRWHACTCVGWDHRYDCPEKAKMPIPF